MLMFPVAAPQLGNCAHAFVTENPSYLDGGNIALQNIKVGAADRRRIDLYYHAGRLQDRRVKYLFPGLLARTFQTSSSQRDGMAKLA